MMALKENTTAKLGNTKFVSFSIRCCIALHHILSPVLLPTVIRQINEKRCSDTDLAVTPYLWPVSFDDVPDVVYGL